MTTKISIITPSLNQATYLQQTIESVLEQSYRPLEYIIIDGGSSDGSVEIIKKYEKHLTYWVSEPDLGQSDAINKGLRRATGDIIAYLNSDDLYHTGTLQRVSQAFQCAPDAGLYYGRCRIVDEDGFQTGLRTGAIANYAEMLNLWDIWWNNRNFVQPEVFWTRAAFDKVGYFRQDLYYVMDYDYWARIYRAGFTGFFIDADLACFRLHSMQKSTRPQETARELLSMVQPLLWEKGRLDPSTRVALQGRWLYDTVFREAAARSLSLGEKPSWRYLRLAKLLLQYPQLSVNGSVRGRLASAIRAFLPLH